MGMNLPIATGGEVPFCWYGIDKSDDFKLTYAAKKNRRILKKWIQEHINDLNNQLTDHILDNMQCYG